MALFAFVVSRQSKAGGPKRAEYVRVFKPVFEQIAQQSGQSIGYFEDMATRIAPQFLTGARSPQS